MLSLDSFPVTSSADIDDGRIVSQVGTLRLCPYRPESVDQLLWEAFAPLVCAVPTHPDRFTHVVTRGCFVVVFTVQCRHPVAMDHMHSVVGAVPHFRSVLIQRLDCLSSTAGWTDACVELASVADLLDHVVAQTGSDLRHPVVRLLCDLRDVGQRGWTGGFVRFAHWWTRLSRDEGTLSTRMALQDVMRAWHLSEHAQPFLTSAKQPSSPTKK